MTILNDADLQFWSRHIVDNEYELIADYGTIYSRKAASYAAINLKKLPFGIHGTDGYEITISGVGDGTWGNNISIPLTVNKGNEMFEWFSLTQYKEMTIPNTFIAYTVIVLEHVKAFNVSYRANFLPTLSIFFVFFSNGGSLWSPSVGSPNQTFPLNFRELIHDRFQVFFGAMDVEYRWSRLRL